MSKRNEEKKEPVRAKVADSKQLRMAAQIEEGIRKDDSGATYKVDLWVCSWLRDARTLAELIRRRKLHRLAADSSFGSYDDLLRDFKIPTLEKRRSDARLVVTNRNVLVKFSDWD